MDQEITRLEQKSRELVGQLKRLHQSFAPKLHYPQEPKSALYDIDRNYLIGSFKPEVIHWNEKSYTHEGMIYLITKLYPYYLGAAYLVTASKFPKEKVAALQRKLLLFSLFALLVIVITAIFLGKLFVAPAQESIKLLDTFIKDATHELNTPISTIITNIELFKELHPELDKNEELERIELAAKRLSKIFNDLAFLQLHHKVKKEPRPTKMDALLQERINYFLPLMESKKITLHTHIEPVTLTIDPSDAQTIIDNLLSNAIKYNRSGGKLSVILTTKKLAIEDSGIGMKHEDLKKVTRRFFRANDQEGGFGLGLFIVKELCHYYGFELHIESQYQKGTKVEILW